MADSTNDTSPAPVTLSPEEVVKELRGLRVRLSLPQPAAVPVSPRRRLANVDQQFVAAAINAVGVSDVVQTALGRTDEDLRQETDAVIRWTAVIDELRSLLREILQANTQRRQRVGLAALQTYKICEQLARDETHATRLAAHIGEMKKLNKFGRSRRKAPQPDAQPAP